MRVNGQRGITTRLAAGAVVLHQFETSLHSLATRCFCYGKSEALMVRKHPYYPARLTTLFLREEKGGRRLPSGVPLRLA